MSDFPRMLYKYPGTSRDAQPLQDGKYEVKVVGSAAEIPDGWSLTPGEAKALHESSKSKPETTGAKIEDGAPTRAELEQMAKDIGVTFDGRTNDKRLAALISTKLAE